MNDETAPIDGADDGEVSAIGELLDLLAEEFADRCRRGEAPTITEYQARHPEHAERIGKLLPTVALMEGLRRGALSGPGPAAPPMPERLGEFRVLRELGRGGMGVVYEAIQESLGRRVALKVIHHVHLDEKRLQRFRREAQAVAQLHHTNIVPVFGVGDHDGLPFYVMQYIAGSGLDARLGAWREGGSPPREGRPRFAARVGRQAAEAIQHAHEQGVLHRDIKPANLLIDEHEALWVTDFGLAKLAGHEDLTASGDVIGTLRYLAPEALRGESGPRSDVYSLGLTLYELLTLNPPFGDLSPSELLHRVGEGALPRPRRLEPAIPRDLETIVLKAIAREPAHRYATAGAMAEDLQRFLEDRPIRARRANGFERLWRWGRRNRALASLSAVAAASILLAAVFGWVGYLTASRALRQSDANVALSLAVFEELFETLAAKDSVPPPPLGRSVREGIGVPGGGPSGNPRPGPPPPDGRGPPDRPPPGGPPGERRGAPAEIESALLRTVLTFYTRFARQNAADPRLQGEAAWAHRKVGALYERLGRTAEAEAAYARAIEMFEGLVALHPKVAEYRDRLVNTYDMADPWTAPPSALETLDLRLRRARDLIEGLARESPGSLTYAQTRLHVVAKLAVVLQRRGLAAEAESCYRRAIDVAGEALDRWPRVGRLHFDRSIAEESLARLLIARGRKDEARALLESAAADLLALHVGAMPAPPERFRGVADAFRELGDPRRAEEVAAQAGAGGPAGPRPPDTR